MTHIFDGDVFHHEQTQEDYFLRLHEEGEDADEEFIDDEEAGEDGEEFAEGDDEEDDEEL